MTQRPLLEIQRLCVNYGGIQALQNLDLVIYPGEVVTLVGANGAGKSTTLRAISRLLQPRDGQILFDGQLINTDKPHQVVRKGIAHSPEGRQVLTQQSVYDNLLLGAYSRSDRLGIKSDLETQWVNFPRLFERKTQIAGTLSGGEQQMLAIARALMSRPKLLLLDEPSLGLAPNIVREIFMIIQKLRDQGMTVLLVEQNANLALQCANRGYVLEAGEIKLSGAAQDLLGDERVKTAYLG